MTLKIRKYLMIFILCALATALYGTAAYRVPAVSARSGRLFGLQLLAECFGREPDPPTKQSREVGGVGKPQHLRHLIDGHAGVSQQALGFQQLAVMHDLQRRLPTQFPTRAVQV